MKALSQGVSGKMQDVAPGLPPKLLEPRAVVLLWEGQAANVSQPLQPCVWSCHLWQVWLRGLGSLSSLLLMGHGLCPRCDKLNILGPQLPPPRPACRVEVPCQEGQEKKTKDDQFPTRAEVLLQEK